MLKYIIIGWSSLLFLYILKKTIKHTYEYIYLYRTAYDVNRDLLISLKFKLYIIYLCILSNVGIFTSLMVKNNSLENILLSGLTTNIFLIILFSLIIKYLKISFNKKLIFNWYVFVFVSIMNTIIFSFLQYYIDYVLFKSIKILIYSFIIIIISVKINIIMYNTKKLLYENFYEINKINYNIIIYNIFSAFIILYQIITTIIQLIKKDENTIDSYIYPIIELISLILIIYWLFKKKHYNNINNPLYK